MRGECKLLNVTHSSPSQNKINIKGKKTILIHVNVYSSEQKENKSKNLLAIIIQLDYVIWLRW